MGYKIRDKYGNVIGEQETDDEREFREWKEGCVAVIVVIVFIFSIIAKYWYIALPIVVVIYLIYKATQKQEEKQNELDAVAENEYNLASQGCREFIASNKTDGAMHYVKIKMAKPRTQYHEWEIDFITFGNGNAVLHETVMPKQENTYVYDEIDESNYIEDCDTGLVYKKLMSSLGTKENPTILKVVAKYKYLSVYEDLPETVKRINLWESGICCVENLKIR